MTINTKAALAVAAVITTLFAAPVTSEEEAVTADFVCSSYGGFAEAVMTRRQEDVPQSALRKLVIESVDDPDQKAVFLDVVSRAYSQYPAFMTDESRQRVTREFRNQAESDCYEIFGE